MKTLKIILGTTYAVLILLLLLTNLRCCTISSSIEPEITLPEPSESPQPMPTPNDTIVQQAEEVGQSGALKITLLWDFQGDIDLHVKQPNGTTIYYEKKKDLLPLGGNEPQNFIWVSFRDYAIMRAERRWLSCFEKAKKKIVRLYMI